MHELNIINTYLGGHTITIAGLRKILFHSSMALTGEVVICEIGCGGGDNLLAIAEWCKKSKITASFIGIDINADCVQVAREMCHELKADFIHADYKEANFDKKPDIIFSSLFCHHFSNEEIVGMLQWMRNNSIIGFFINDLHRNQIAYHSIKWLSRIFSRSYLVRNDAPLSVARGFSRLEWKYFLNTARIPHFTLQWKWAFRWLIVAVNEDQLSSLHS